MDVDRLAIMRRVIFRFLILYDTLIRRYNARDKCHTLYNNNVIRGCCIA